MTRRPSIIGWNHSKFGRLDEPDVTALIGSVVPEALAHAEVTASEVDGLFVGVYNNGFSNQDFQAALVSITQPELQFTPAMRVENACGTGSAAIYAACDFIASGRGDVAVVIGAEKMTGVDTPRAGEILLSGCYRPEESDVVGGFAGVFAGIASAYADRYGDPSAAMASIAVKNHHNGMTNPYAQLHKDLSFDFCNDVSDKNPYIAAPLRRTDCSLISDGAVAVVITSADRASSAPRRVSFRARAHANDFLPLSRRDPIEFAGAHRAWNQALDQASVSTLDLDFIETHDCFTIAELIQYEVFGLVEPGRGHEVVEQGLAMPDGKIPINRSGGLKAKGHPIGATGVSMHAIAAMQLTGEAGSFQLPTADIGGIFNMGGTAVTNYASILERW
ncbi:acetyl-CoA acetyltransferase [Rhodococcus fascians]|nr:acetyl-CoA acetyltransferase [Rhodococcus fascians]MBY3997804.1 acetyl-CoA acetyltransferase [Rhodococcus fascians]MBY4002813.1 acetyl-CoA acetyltransferase [Rhodococcus fascians]MBY4006804.1 acetyl-CoA acetyltransferase [Rhodococcus fascians]MBY4019411.1 acetyl-CoA acetyltransferase [Rhodococcus fascians]